MERVKKYLCVSLPGTAPQILEKIGRWALRFTPLVGVDYERGVALDLSGTVKLYGDAQELGLKIRSALNERGITCRICIAPTLGAAWACALYAKDDLLLSAQSMRAALAPLPVQALRLSPPCLAVLKPLGITHIAQLLKLPRKGLGLRFGAELLKRLDQALGFASETFQALQNEKSLALRKIFENPLLSHESIKLCVLDLLDALFQTLAQQHRSAANLRLEFITPKRTLYTRELSLYSASKSFTHVSQIVAPLLEQLSIPEGVKEIRIDAHRLEANLTQQHEFGADGSAADLERAKAELIDRLGMSLGKQALKRLELKASHVPERAFSYDSLYQAPNCAAELDLAHDRPPYLLRRPEPFEAISLLPDRPPTRITWKGRSSKILKALGPEKIAPEWWQRRLAPEQERALGERQYFKIQDESGVWLWVFRTSSMRWFVHGIWV